MTKGVKTLESAIAVDPVCGMKVEPAKAAAELDYRATKNYFCPKHCLQSFRADPERYLDRSHDHAGHGHECDEAAAQNTGERRPAVAEYTCR